MDALYQSFAYWRAGGPLLILLAMVCFGIWGYFFKIGSYLKDVLRAPKQLEHSLMEDLSEHSLEQASAHFALHSGMLSSAVAYVLKAVYSGEKAAEAFENFSKRELSRLERDLGVLAALTAAAPLLGLLGTVLGMVHTFSSVSSSQGGQIPDISSGISQALITTQFGLVIAIPGVFGLSRLRRSLQRVHVRFSSLRTHLLIALETRGASQ